MTSFVSPNELHLAARRAMIDGREPVSEDDWARCVNFWAANIDPAVGTAAIPLIAKILDCPLPRELILEIAEFQFAAKQQRH